MKVIISRVLVAYAQNEDLISRPCVSDNLMCYLSILLTLVHAKSI